MNSSDPTTSKSNWLEKLGITRRQIALIFFLVLLLVVGMMISSWKQMNGVQLIAEHDKQEEYKKLNTGIAKVESLYSATKHFSNVKYSSSIKNKININRASKDELVELPGIGPVLAQRILNYRKSNKKFSASDELMNVKGIGKITMKKIKPFLKCE